MHMDATNPALGMSRHHDGMSTLLHIENPYGGSQAGAACSRSVVRSGTGWQDRQSERISVIGKAQVRQSSSAPLEARLNDISMSGFSLFLDFQLRLLQSYQLQLAIFRHGHFHRVDVRAQCVYALLVRADGFKHGFEFIGLNAAAEDAIRAILA